LNQELAGVEPTAATSSTSSSITPAAKSLPHGSGAVGNVDAEPAGAS
jgi:hypothetical protein